MLVSLEAHKLESLLTRSTIPSNQAQARHISHYIAIECTSLFQGQTHAQGICSCLADRTDPSLACCTQLLHMVAKSDSM